MVTLKNNSNKLLKLLLEIQGSPEFKVRDERAIFFFVFQLFFCPWLHAIIDGVVKCSTDE